MQEEKHVHLSGVVGEVGGGRVCVATTRNTHAENPIKIRRGLKGKQIQGVQWSRGVEAQDCGVK